MMKPERERRATHLGDSLTPQHVVAATESGNSQSTLASQWFKVLIFKDNARNLQFRTGRASEETREHETNRDQKQES